MNELEQIEIWRNQFESAIKETAPYHLAIELLRCDMLEKNRISEKYINTNIEAIWQGFLLARRSMAAIEIPSYDLHHYAPVRNITAQMDAAGYKYKIKL